MDRSQEFIEILSNLKQEEKGSVRNRFPEKREPIPTVNTTIYNFSKPFLSECTLIVSQN